LARCFLEDIAAFKIKFHFPAGKTRRQRHGV
jgi:hypothetical protein